MANPTIAAQIAELEAELVLVKAQMASALTAATSYSLGDLSVSMSAANVKDCRDRRREIEKSLQRLYRGGRGIQIDMSYPGTTSPISTENQACTPAKNNPRPNAPMISPSSM